MNNIFIACKVKNWIITVSLAERKVAYTQKFYKTKTLGAFLNTFLKVSSWLSVYIFFK